MRVTQKRKTPGKPRGKGNRQTEIGRCKEDEGGRKGKLQGENERSQEDGRQEVKK